MERTTQKQLDCLVAELNKRLGFPLEPHRMVDGKTRSNAGNIHIDSGYGGYRLEQMVSADNCGTREYGHSYRMSRRELWCMLRGMHEVLDTLESQKQRAA